MAYWLPPRALKLAGILRCELFVLCVTAENRTKAKELMEPLVLTVILVLKSAVAGLLLITGRLARCSVAIE